MDKVWLKDASERVLWTAAEVGIGAVIVEVTPLEGQWIVPLVVVLTAIKTAIANKIGSSSAAIGGPQG
jgi:hypothetical protein